MATRPYRFHDLRLLLTAIGVLGVFTGLLPMVRNAGAVGEPTVSISIGDAVLTAGETTDVTFVFSSPPLDFDASDVFLAPAEGTISPVAASSVPTVWSATFTPTAGVVAPGNRIVVGTAWTDGIGVAPLAPSSSGNFSIDTTVVPPPASGSGSSCGPTALTLNKPNGGETLPAGEGVDVLWSVSTCDAALAVEVFLSIDEGANYSLLALSNLPLGGFARVTLPPTSSTAARLRLRLVGQGDVELARDVSDGTFRVVSDAPPLPPAEPMPAPADEPATTPAPAAEEPQATTVPPNENKTALPSEAPTASSTPNTPAPAERVVIPVVPASRPEGGPPIARGAKPDVAPVVVEPLLPPDLNPVPMPIEPTTTDQLAHASAPETSPASVVERVSTSVDAASQFAPPALSPWVSFILGALAMMAAMFAVQSAMKRDKLKSLHRCTRCLGSGEEPPKGGFKKCDECEGSGTVDEEEEETAECKHCDGEGEDPCHRCKGTGEVAGQTCPACQGGGKTLTKEKDRNGEPVVKACEICRGEGEITATIKKKVQCEKCHGAGRLV